VEAVLNLPAMVANETMSAEMAATLQLTAELQRSFLVVAIPRWAGKSTVSAATLACAPASTPIRVLIDHPGDLDALTGSPAEGYLVVPEVSESPVPGYIWGEPVRRVFAALDRGYALATALHAPGLDEAFAVLRDGNGVPDEHASHIDVMVYLRSLGDDWRAPTRRVLAEMYEIEAVEEGRPRARMLHRWDEEANRFEQLSEPSLPAAAAGGLEERAAFIRRAADAHAAG
jgi:hypothetical protein